MTKLFNLRMLLIALGSVGVIAGVTVSGIANHWFNGTVQTYQSMAAAHDVCSKSLDGDEGSTLFCVANLTLDPNCSTDVMYGLAQSASHNGTPFTYKSADRTCSNELAYQHDNALNRLDRSVNPDTFWDYPDSSTSQTTVRPLCVNFTAYIASGCDPSLLVPQPNTP